MKSGWKINFKSGATAILTEEQYLKEKAMFNIDEIKSEEHWFDINLLKEEEQMKKTSC